VGARDRAIPADERIDQIGHMGFFKQDAAPLWPPVIGWLDRH
jgi:predicted alpha/beta hydrolase